MINDLNQRLEELREEVAKRDPRGWDDYMWCVEEGDFVKGQISILEEILNENGS